MQVEGGNCRSGWKIACPNEYRTVHTDLATLAKQPPIRLTAVVAHPEQSKDQPNLQEDDARDNGRYPGDGPIASSMTRFGSRVKQ